MKKLVSIVLALAMVLMVGASFADAHEVTITPSDSNDTAGHTYAAYQIFNGTSNPTGGTAPVDPKIDGVTWGAALTGKGDAFVTALKAHFTSVAAITALPATGATAAQVSGALSGLSTDQTKELAEVIASFITAQSLSATATSTSANGKVTVPGDGYYFIKDVTNPESGDSENTVAGASSRYILEVIGNVSITSKASVPTVVKEVDDRNDSNSTEDGLSWATVADYDVGDIVPFRIIGTIPSTYGDYARYNYIFHDTMSTGLSYFTGTHGSQTYATKVVLYADQAALTADTTATGGTDITSYFTVTGSGQSFNVGVNNYATTGADKTGLKLVPGITTNSKIVVYYYAQVTENAVVRNRNDATIEFSNNPNAGGEGETGTTPPSHDLVFTYKVIVNKTELDTNSNTTGATKPLTGAGFTLFKKYTTANATLAGKTAATMPTSGITSEQWALADGFIWVDVGAPTLSANSGVADATFTFPKLDDGDYLLVETTTPVGYNTAAPVTFAITNSSTSTIDLGSIANFTKDDTEGSQTTSILNSSGTTLPQTGGIGTTIFYIVGGLLLVGAAVILVARKKAND